jgi:hypothetical protein
MTFVFLSVCLSVCLSFFLSCSTSEACVYQHDIVSIDNPYNPGCMQPTIVSVLGHQLRQESHRQTQRNWHHHTRQARMIPFNVARPVERQSRRHQGVASYTRIRIFMDCRLYPDNVSSLCLTRLNISLLSLIHSSLLCVNSLPEP